MARHPLAAPLVSLFLIGAPQGAFAHASLIGSDPPDGTALASAPSEIVLRFDEEVVPIRLRLVDTRGTEITPSSPPPAAASVLRAKYARDLLPESVYFFSYRVTSADGHPIAGTIVFSVASAQAVRKSDGAGNSAVSSDWIIWAAAARWIFYLCAALAAGGVIFQLAVIDIPFALRPVLCSAAILGAFIALLQIGIRGALLLDGRAVELLGAAPWDESFATPLGLSLLLAAAGMAGCGVVLSLRRKKFPVLSLASIIFVLVSFPLSGHAATAAPRWLTGPALLIHVAAAMFWIGAFVPLRAVLNTSAPAPVVDRFSRIAVPAVLFLGHRGCRPGHRPG